MTKDIKELLDETAGREPLTAFDADAALKRGHGAMTRRRLAVGGLTTGVVAIVAAAIVALPAVMGPAGSGDPNDPGPGANAAQDPDALPELNPEKYYTWTDDYLWRDSEPTELPRVPTDLTVKYDDAFFGLLDEEYGGYERVEYDEFLRTTPTLIETDEPVTGSDGDPFEIIDEQVAYRLKLGIVNGADGLQPWGKDKGEYEGLGIDVRAPGGFGEGTEGPGNDSVNGYPGFFDLVGCSDYEDAIQAGQTITVEVECTEKETAKGEKLIEVTEVIERGTEYEGTNRKVVLYRVDGSAVIVTDSSGEAKQELTFDFDDLTAMATVLPLEPVL